ncbi:MAG: polymer-forming cytoskeletal protein [Gammaproteobacteria bacterium]|nr:polymer-forming cytoskeletal protein [Gammaproteobacteria bacterium]
MGSERRRLSDRQTGAMTVVAAGARFEGRLSGKGAVIVSGQVIGECDFAGTVTIADGGHWEGRLHADDVMIAGRVAGDVVARGRVEMGQRAQVTGTVTGLSVAIAEGAVIEGELRAGARGEDAPVVFSEKRHR